MLARCCGKSDVHNLEPEDLRTPDARSRGDHRHSARREHPPLSKHIVTADDVRHLAESGERELMLREHTVLTDAAADAAAQLGIRLVEGSTYSTTAADPVAPPARPGAGALPPPALQGLSLLSRGQTPPREPHDIVTPSAPPRRGAGGLPSPAIVGLARSSPAAESAGSESAESGLALRYRQSASAEDLAPITRLLIGGEWVDATGGETVPTIDPATNTTIVEVAAAQAEDVDRAVRAARAAFPAWRDLAPEKRSRILLRVAELIEAEQERLARIESLDVGKPIREAALIDLPGLLGSLALLPGPRPGDRRPGARAAEDVVRLRAQGADGRRRHDHPVELPAPHRLPQGLGRARGGQHRRAQGSRARAADLSRARADLPRGRPARPVSSTSCPGSARSPGRRSPSTPASTRSRSPARRSRAAR